MTQPAVEQLLNLTNRAEKGLSPDEAQRLRDGLTHHCARAEKAERCIAEYRESRRRWMEAAEADRRTANEQHARAERAEATIRTFSAIFEGFGRLLATSSRDWAEYAVDAWLWAVVLGWDCEETEHDNTCVHGVMEEMAEAHGWDEAAVAKARRYRAAVRAALDLQEPQPGANTKES